MVEIILRGEKVPANIIPENRFEQFKYKLIEESEDLAERNLMLFQLGIATGYRMQDLVCLTIGEIIEATKNGEFIIEQQKNKNAYKTAIKKNPHKKIKKPKPRAVRIGKNLRKLLMNYCKGKEKSSYAFPSTKTNSHISAKSYSIILSNVGKKLGLKNISGHSLRKVYATRQYEDTRDLEFVRRAVGHTKIDTTKEYLGFEEEIIDRASEIADSRL